MESASRAFDSYEDFMTELRELWFLKRHIRHILEFETCKLHFAKRWRSWTKYGFGELFCLRIKRCLSQLCNQRAGNCWSLRGLKRAVERVTSIYIWNKGGYSGMATWYKSGSKKWWESLDKRPLGTKKNRWEVLTWERTLGRAVAVHGTIQDRVVTTKICLMFFWPCIIVQWYLG